MNPAINRNNTIIIIFNILSTSTNTIYITDFLFLLFQSTHEGFGHVSSENVFKVCDEPHPLLIKEMLSHCSKSDLDPAYKIAKKLWNLGYSAEDIITNIFRVCKTHNELAEYMKLEFIKVKK